MGVMPAAHSTNCAPGWPSPSREFESRAFQYQHWCVLLLVVWFVIMLGAWLQVEGQHSRLVCSMCFCGTIAAAATGGALGGHALLGLGCMCCEQS